jgi:hypothetical protein
MQFPKSKRLIICLWSLPISGILAIFALFLRNFVGLPGENLLEWAQAVSSNAYLFSQYMYILAYVLPFFGFWALYMYLLQHNVERLAFWGLMGTLIGTGLPLTTLGVFAYASPELGRLYLSGDTHLPQVITEIALGSSLVLGMPGAFIYVGGCTLFGIAVWKSGALTRWSGILLALHGLFLSFGFSSPPLIILGWVCLIFSGVWFVWSVSRRGAATSPSR